MAEDPQNLTPATPENKPKKHGMFEPVALVFLSLATVGTAWCSFEAASWGAVSQRTLNRSAAESRKAAADQLQAYQMALLDVLLFSQHINARASSNEVLARFYADRFRGEAKAAFESWMSTQPFDNPQAPPHPFVTNLYKPRLLAKAREEETVSEQLWTQAGEAGRTSRTYVLITVLLASALFCSGTASKFEILWIRRTALGVGLMAFAVAACLLFSLPVRL
jgi:hypothetical protein